MRVVWRAAVYLAMGDIERADRDYARAETLYAECGQQAEYAYRAPGTRSGGTRPW